MYAPEYQLPLCRRDNIGDSAAPGLVHGHQDAYCPLSVLRPGELARGVGVQMHVSDDLKMHANRGLPPGQIKICSNCMDTSASGIGARVRCALEACIIANEAIQLYDAIPSPSISAMLARSTPASAVNRRPRSA